MMTKEELKPVMAAWLNDQPIEFRCSDAGGWREASGIRPDFFNPEFEWRVKPEKKLRPWKPEEVPPFALYRRKAWVDVDKHSWSVILGFHYGQIEFGIGYCDARRDTLESALENAEHSTDGGKSWHPCGVEE